MSGTDSRPQPILVVACGNREAGDDAFGPLVADSLRRASPEGVEVLDLGMNPAGILDSLSTARDALFIVDAVQEPGDLGFSIALGEGLGAEAGAVAFVHEVEWTDVRSNLRDALGHHSSHGLSLATQLALGDVLGILPPVVRLFLAPGSRFAVGSSPGPRVEAFVAEASRRIQARVRECLRPSRGAHTSPP